MLEARARDYPGRAIVNSINMENGRDRIEAVVPIVDRARRRGRRAHDRRGRHGEDRATRKLEVARAIYDIFVDEYGLAPEDLIFDALTFTLATGDEEWIDSARRDDRGHPR